MWWIDFLLVLGELAVLMMISKFGVQIGTFDVVLELSEETLFQSCFCGWLCGGHVGDAIFKTSI